MIKLGDQMGLLNQGSIFYWLSCIVAYFKFCDKVCQWYAAYRWFSPGTPVYSTIKTDHHDITEILLKVTLNTINQPFGWNTVFGFSMQNGWKLTQNKLHINNKEWISSFKIIRLTQINTLSHFIILIAVNYRIFRVK